MLKKKFRKHIKKRTKEEIKSTKNKFNNGEWISIHHLFPEYLSLNANESIQVNMYIDKLNEEIISQEEKVCVDTSCWEIVKVKIPTYYEFYYEL